MKLREWVFLSNSMILIMLFCQFLILFFVELTAQKERLDLAINYNAQFIQYYQQGALIKALPSAEKSYRMSKDILGEKHLVTLTTMNNLAFIYHDIGRIFNCFRTTQQSKRD